MAIINTDYEIAYSKPLRLKVGDAFEVVPKDIPDKWAGWHWAQTGNQAGWISKHYFEKRDDRFVVIRDYDGAELSVHRGASVALKFQDCGWSFIEDQEGNRGWIPSEIISALEIQDMLAFILEGKLKGWVGGLEGGKEISPTRIGSNDIVFDRSRFHYHDSFVGFSDFLGQEHVAFDGKAVWSMSYFGYLLKPDRFSAQDAVRVLKQALPTMYLVEKRFLGGFVQRFGDFEYRDVNYGDWQRFHGLEKIFADGELVYELMYFGGCVRE